MSHLLFSNQVILMAIFELRSYSSYFRLSLIKKKHGYKTVVELERTILRPRVTKYRLQ